MEDLEALERQHGNSFDYIHIAAAFTKAGHLSTGQDVQLGRMHVLMRRLSQRLKPNFAECDTQALANIVWACGKAAYADAALLDACLSRLVGGASAANPFDVANALYGAALLWDNGYQIDKRHA